jgi:3-oxoacyl-[acyl-carrier-protein] synthase II
MIRREEIWITGVGTANPLGLDLASTSAALLDGRSGIRALTDPVLAQHTCRIGGLLPPLPPPSGWEADTFSRLDPTEQLLLYCSVQALREAGCWDERSRIRVGLVVGLGAEWMETWELQWPHGGPDAMHPQRDPAPVVQRVRQQLSIGGPVLTVAAACASGNFALVQARRLLTAGFVDVCLAGGIDRCVSFMSLAAFGNLGVLSRRNSDPVAASRPFDRDRDGLVLSEAGAMFVLERESKARRRGAHPHAALAGFGSSSDAFHMIIPSPNPEPAVQAVRESLADARINPDEVDYVNAHATSTPVGDRNETNVLRSVLGDAAARVPVSATKSMTGHPLSAAAGIDALACLAALEHQAIPPTINLENPDPECDLCHVRNEARPQRVRVALSNSFGFGGSNSCLVLRKAA